MLKKIKLSSVIIIALIAVVSCKCKDVTTNKNDADLNNEKNMITQESHNSDKTLLLITSYKDDINSRRIINYKVLEVSSKKVVKEGTFEGMKLEWLGTNQLKGYLHIGMVQKDNDNVLLEGNKNDNKNILIIDIK